MSEVEVVEVAEEAEEAVEEKVEKKGFFGEFKEFALRGNVMDMAVGVVIGAAFSAIINSLVADIIMPILGLLTGNYDFSKLAIQFSEDNVLTYGMFIQAIINFILIVLVLFLIIKFFNKIRKENKEETPAGPTEVDVLTEIRDLLKDK